MLCAWGCLQALGSESTPQNLAVTEGHVNAHVFLQAHYVVASPSCTLLLLSFSCCCSSYNVAAILSNKGATRQVHTTAHTPACVLGRNQAQWQHNPALYSASQAVWWAGALGVALKEGKVYTVATSAQVACVQCAIRVVRST